MNIYFENTIFFLLLFFLKWLKNFKWSSMYLFLTFAILVGEKKSQNRKSSANLFYHAITLAWRIVLVFILIKAAQCYFFLSATAKCSWMSNKKQLFLLWYQVIFHIIRIAWRLCLMWFYLLFIFLLFYLNDIQVYRNSIKNDITFEYFEKYI